MIETFGQMMDREARERREKQAKITAQLEQARERGDENAVHELETAWLDAGNCGD